MRPTAVSGCSASKSGGRERRPLVSGAYSSREEGFEQAYRRIVELQPWTFLFYGSNSVVRNPRLQGLQANARDPLAVVEQWWIPAHLQ